MTKTTRFLLAGIGAFLNVCAGRSGSVAATVPTTA